MKTEEPEYLVTDDSILVYRLKHYDKKKNKASLIVYKNLEDFAENKKLKEITVGDWL